MGRVIIGMDPHKLSATIEVLDERERVLGGGRYGTDRDGYRQMLAAARRWPDRVWAVEGCNGSAGTWRSGWSPTARRSWMYRRSCRRGRGCSRLGRVVRPMPPTRIRSQSWPYAPRTSIK
jgi:hypothetical protein